MLKGISSLLSPRLLKVLCEMGNSDTIVIGDGNFPSESLGIKSEVIRYDGLGAIKILDAVLKVFPLDTYINAPVKLMEVMPGDMVKTPIWDEYKKIVSKYNSRGAACFEEIERFHFYEESKKAYTIIATGEKALYANVILQKGVV